MTENSTSSVAGREEPAVITLGGTLLAISERGFTSRDGKTTGTEHYLVFPSEKTEYRTLVFIGKERVDEVRAALTDKVGQKVCVRVFAGNYGKLWFHSAL